MEQNKDITSRATYQMYHTFSLYTTQPLMMHTSYRCAIAIKINNTITGERGNNILHVCRNCKKGFTFYKDTEKLFCTVFPSKRRYKWNWNGFFICTSNRHLFHGEQLRKIPPSKLRTLLTLLVIYKWFLYTQLRTENSFKSYFAPL